MGLLGIRLSEKFSLVADILVPDGEQRLVVNLDSVFIKAKIPTIGIIVL